MPCCGRSDMRHVKRHPALPAIEVAAAKELDAARNHRGGPGGSGAFPYTVYKDKAVKEALERLFHGKCAYCETSYHSSAPVDIEHYRPKGRVAEDSAHPGYWWEAMSWPNLLPSCIDCNRKRNQQVPVTSSDLAELFQKSSRLPSGQSGKMDSFPIRNPLARVSAEGQPLDAEQTLLINPCVHDPRDYFVYRFDQVDPFALVLPTSDPERREVAATSIHVFGLNRLGLVQERTRLQRHLEFLGDLVLQLAEMVQDLQVRACDFTHEQAMNRRTGPLRLAGRLEQLKDRTLQELRAMGADDAPHSAMVVAWLEDFAARLDGPP